MNQSATWNQVPALLLNLRSEPHEIIHIEALQRGDIVLTTSTEIESRLIKIGTLSDISHAMVCVSHGSVMDSTAEGVQSRNVQKMFYPDACAIYILRLKQRHDHRNWEVVYAGRAVWHHLSIRPQLWLARLRCLKMPPLPPS